jgi:hypothetical protein
MDDPSPFTLRKQEVISLSQEYKDMPVIDATL